MGILDQLIEKKDVLIYIDERIAHLQRTLDTMMDKIPEKKRNAIKQRFTGRITELNKLKVLINSNRIKDADKQYWHERFDSEKEMIEEVETIRF